MKKAIQKLALKNGYFRSLNEKMPSADGTIYRKLHNDTAKFMREKAPKRSCAQSASQTQKTKKSTQKSEIITSPKGRSSLNKDQDPSPEQSTLHKTTSPPEKFDGTIKSQRQIQQILSSPDGPEADFVDAEAEVNIADKDNHCGGTQTDEDDVSQVTDILHHDFKAAVMHVEGLCLNHDGPLRTIAEVRAAKNFHVKKMRELNAMLSKMTNELVHRIFDSQLASDLQDQQFLQNYLRDAI